MHKQDLDEKRAAYREALAAALERIRATLAANPQVREAILFGSYARGRSDLLTDLDILIVMDSDQDFLTRTAEMYRSMATGVDMDLLVYTPQELERNKDNPFIRRALAEGRRIYERHSA